MMMTQPNAEPPASAPAATPTLDTRHCYDAGWFEALRLLRKEPDAMDRLDVRAMSARCDAARGAYFNALSGGPLAPSCGHCGRPLAMNGACYRCQPIAYPPAATPEPERCECQHLAAQHVANPFGGDERRLCVAPGCPCIEYRPAAPTGGEAEEDAGWVGADPFENGYDPANVARVYRERIRSLMADLAAQASELAALREENDALTMRIGDAEQETATAMADSAGFMRDEKRFAAELFALRARVTKYLDCHDTGCIEAEAQTLQALRAALTEPTSGGPV